MELERKRIKSYEEIFRRYSGKTKLHAVWYVAPEKGIVNLVYRIWRQKKSQYQLPTRYVSYLDEVRKDPMQARLLGEEAPKVIGKTWTPKMIEMPAHSPAQGVSGQSGKIEERRVELSAEDPTPISEDVA